MVSLSSGCSPMSELGGRSRFTSANFSRLVRLIEEHQKFFLEKWDEHFEG